MAGRAALANSPQLWKSMDLTTTFHTDGASVAVQTGLLVNNGVMNVNDAHAARLQEEKQIRVLAALYKSVEKNRKDRNPDRVTGTCEWFTAHQNFREWNSSLSSKMLWVSADPGCGKSVLAKYLIDCVLPNKSRTTCYFFFKDDFEGQGSATTALCCVLFQLFSNKRSLISKKIIERFEITGESFTSSFSELWDTFLIAAKNENAGEIICVLDALDECAESERSQLIKRLYKLYLKDTNFNLKFLVTSRPISEIRDGFCPLKIPESSFIHLSGEAEVEKISQEIEIFIETKVSKIRENYDLTEKDHKLLLERLKCVPNRTYLWVYLVLELIESDIKTSLATNKEIIATVTSRLPRTVDEVYENILSKSSDSEKAKRLLQIVVAANRPLTLGEVSIALQISLKDNHISYSNLRIDQGERIRDRIRDYCGLFVIVVDSKVYLIHQTAKEFLVPNDGQIPSQSAHLSIQWKSSLGLRNSHQLLFHICIQHLFCEELGSDLSEVSASEYAKEYIFLDYAAKNWTTHLQQSQIQPDKTITTSILKLCDAKSKRCQIWFQTYWAGTGKDFPDGVTSLIIASYFGLVNIVKLLLNSENDIDIDSQDSRYGRSALSWAAENGFGTVVMELLWGPRSKWFPWWLTGRAQVDSRDRYGLTPLVYAIWNRHIPVVSELLKAGADVNLQDDILATPFLYAILSRDAGIIELISKGDFKRGLLVNEAVRLFVSAVEKGYDNVVESLLETGVVGTEVQGRWDKRPLYLAVERGHEGLVRLLIAHGADVEGGVVPGEGKTPLMAAVEKGDTLTAQLLIEHGADMEAKYPLRTPLELAVDGGYEDVVKLLLENGADLKGKYGRSLLKRSILKGRNEGIIRLLTQFGADMEKKHKGRTLLLEVLQKRNESAAKLLLKLGANKDATDWDGLTALMYAAGRGYTEVTRQLLELKADVHATTDYGRTALMFAGWRKSTGIIQLLLENGADKDKKGKAGRRALH
ncbi:hypothetical protein TWF718_007399 [Orbilia javanica]|uniref:NACHT domain-containing protein n=1 Tax=Orbilia javanica TaxID=47235 RepID=A0AAN8MU77_9PEZI